MTLFSNSQQTGMPALKRIEDFGVSLGLEKGARKWSPSETAYNPKMGLPKSSQNH
jgi:hypothetical protein